MNIPDENSYYELYYIATFSFAKLYALVIQPSHFIATTSNETQQLTRKDHFLHRRYLSCEERVGYAAYDSDLLFTFASRPP